MRDVDKAVINKARRIHEGCLIDFGREYPHPRCVQCNLKDLCEAVHARDEAGEEELLIHLFGEEEAEPSPAETVVREYAEKLKDQLKEYQRRADRYSSLNDFVRGKRQGLQIAEDYLKELTRKHGIEVG